MAFHFLLLLMLAQYGWEINQQTVYEFATLLK